MTDEMKLKHGILWNSQTGEAVGLVDDMLDMNSQIQRLFLEEGYVVKPAVYINQWRYIAIQKDGTEGWMCGFFYNNGSLTGGTLLRQFDHVTMCCKSIGSHVYGDKGEGSNEDIVMSNDVNQEEVMDGNRVKVKRNKKINNHDQE